MMTTMAALMGTLPIAFGIGAVGRGRHNTKRGLTQLVKAGTYQKRELPALVLIGLAA
jgi:multidrug efflux pump subunit AcrB